MTESKRPRWTELWELSTDMVNCKECHAGQPLEYRMLAFTHKAPCSREGIGQHPCLELLEVMKLMHFADQPLPADAQRQVWAPPKY